MAWKKISDLPVGTKFYVHNGAWDGSITTKDGVKHVHVEGGDTFPLVGERADASLDIDIMGEVEYEYCLSIAIGNLNNLKSLHNDFIDMLVEERNNVDDPITGHRDDYLTSTMKKQTIRIKAIEDLFFNTALKLTNEELSLFTGGYKNEEHLPGGRPYRY